jgi:purine-binding chemotaxis protein CheW
VDNNLSERTAGILDLATERRREHEVVDVEQQRTLLVVFRLGGDGAATDAPSLVGEGYYGLPASLVESIVIVQEITYVPGTPDWVLGVINVRGEIESVLDLGAVLGLGVAEVGVESRLLIAQHGELRSGLLVDRVIDIADIPTSSISSAPLPEEGSKGIYVQGEADYLGKPLLILDLPEILNRALEADRV